MLCGYLQLNCTEESSKLLGIQTESKTYTLKRLHFGLVTSHFVFQQLMNKMLTGYQYIFAVAYLDDTLLYSCVFVTHLRHLTLVLDRFQDAGIRLRADKCQIAVPEIKYLGMIFGRGCMKMDPEKLHIIKEAKAPMTAKLLKSFLSLCSFYRRFIRGFSQKIQVFRPLLVKNATYTWTDEHQKAFEQLKRVMTEAPICLHFPSWTEDIVLISDSSKLGCGYIVCNRDAKGNYKVLMYGGRVWNKHESNWSVTEQELAGIIFAIERNTQLFLGRKFYIITHHLSNVHVNSLKHSHGKLYRWSLRLQNYNFEIEHIASEVLR